MNFLLTYTTNDMTAEEKKFAKDYLDIALGGNMNISTLKLKFWYEIMVEFAKAYYQAKNTEITEADIGKWVRETELEDVSSSRGDILTFWEAFKNGEIKHINKQ